MSDTPLLQLPLLEAAQAQKHVTHNEALLLLDGLVHLSVASRVAASPPAAATDGTRHLVAASPTGAWAGQAGKLALAQGGGWVFLEPRTGWRLWVEDERKFLLFDGQAWIEPGGAELSNVPRLGVNTAADDVNRLAVAAPAVLLSHAGSGLQVKLNKNQAVDTASLLYQTGWSGRAEMGLTGDDDFRIKVSADGAIWRDAMVVNRVTGAVSLPNTPRPAAGAGMLFAQSLAAQGPGFAVEAYLTGSAITIPAGALVAGTRYRCVFDVSKTAAGVAPPVLRLRFGNAAALTAAVLVPLSFPDQTAAADDGRFSLEATFRRVGGGTGAQVQVVGALTHTLAAGGLSTGAGPVRRATSAGFSSDLADAVIGVSVLAGTGAAWTVSLVQASLENLA